VAKYRTFFNSDRVLCRPSAGSMAISSPFGKPYHLAARPTALLAWGKWRPLIGPRPSIHMRESSLRPRPEVIICREYRKAHRTQSRPTHTTGGWKACGIGPMCGRSRQMLPGRSRPGGCTGALFVGSYCALAGIINPRIAVNEMAAANRKVLAIVWLVLPRCNVRATGPRHPM
jgi:hypothetical protein